MYLCQRRTYIRCVESSNVISNRSPPCGRIEAGRGGLLLPVTKLHTNHFFCCLSLTSFRLVPSIKTSLSLLLNWQKHLLVMSQKLCRSVRLHQCLIRFTTWTVSVSGTSFHSRVSPMKRGELSAQQSDCGNCTLGHDLMMVFIRCWS